MAKYVFNKNIKIVYDTTNFPSDTRNVLVRTYNDAVVDAAGVADPSQILVSYNGQRILRRTTEPVGTFARFYYELSMTNSSFTITVTANPSYTVPHYTGSPTVALQIDDNDVFLVDYTYTVTV